MIAINEICNNLQNEYSIKDSEFKISFVLLMERNNWFGVKKEERNGVLYISDFNKNTKKLIHDFCLHFEDNIEDKVILILNKLEEELPKTKKIYEQFIKDKNYTNETIYNLADTLVRYLVGELVTSSNEEIRYLVSEGCEYLGVYDSQQLAYFLAYVKKNYNTLYQSSYVIKQRIKPNTDAYDQETYFKMIYVLFNEKYIKDNRMLYKASQSKNYIDIWLFLAIHFISAIRNSDLILFPHPVLPRDPKIILKEVIENKFEDWEAKYVLASLLAKVKNVEFRPNKTKRFNGISDIKFFVPTSCEVLIGTLFAIAEAHYIISNSKGPLIKENSKYRYIKKHLGDEIGEIFLESDFKSRSANKSYMQLINDLGKEIENNDSYSVKGYMLAALARSHKHSYNHFAETTVAYLRDAKMNGHSVDFVAKELFERGVLSYFSSLLLRLLSQGKFDDLNFEQQTQAIKLLDLSVNEIDTIFCQLDTVKHQSFQLAKELCIDKEKAIQTLHLIANGNSSSKQENVDCIMTALRKPCQYNQQNCINCPFQLKTKSTLMNFIEEYNNHKNEFKNNPNILVKAKNKYLALYVIAPAMSEMLSCLEAEYGHESIEDLERIINVRK